MLRCFGVPFVLCDLLRLRAASALQVSPDDYENGEMPIGVYNGTYGYLPIDRVERWGKIYRPFRMKAPGGDGDIYQFVRQLKGRKYFNSAYQFSVPEVRYNPSLVVLPDAVAKRLGNGAYYLATFRHNYGQCRRLAASIPTVNRSDHKAFTTVVVLDREFGYVASEPISGSDCRLFVDGELVYITRGFSTVHLEGMDLRLDGGALRVSFTSDRELSRSNDRNFGLLKHEGKLQVLRWPGETMDVRSMRRAPPPKPVAAMTDEDLAAYASFHNSVNPLELPEHDAFLGIGHVHINKECAWCPRKRGPRAGYSYVHYFVLFDRGEPWGMRHMSPPFCIPSAANATRCEIVQFVMSAIREGDDLLLTYGVNDCEAAMIRAPLKAVLEFTRGASAGQPFPGEAPSGARLSASPVL